MELEPQPCSKCGADTRTDRALAHEFCSACGGALPSEAVSAATHPYPASAADDAADRRLWIAGFWLAFLLAPITPVAAVEGVGLLVRRFPGIMNVTGNLLFPLSVLGSFAAVVLCSSYCLLRYRSETFSRTEAVAHLILQAIGIAIAAITILVGVASRFPDCFGW